MSLPLKNFEEKPYNMCLNCAHIGKRCDGPNFLAMSTDRWCEWCHLRKDYLGWTNAHVAELAGVSKNSVDRVMRGETKDLRISTMQGITKALVNGSWGQYPCVSEGLAETQTVYVDNPDLVAKAEHAEQECARLKAILDDMTAEHKHDIENVHSDDQREIDFLKEQVHFKEEQMKAKDKLIQERYEFLKRKDRVILSLSIMLVVAVLVIIAALVIDRINPEMGFFWLRGWFGGGSSLQTILRGTT